MNKPSITIILFLACFLSSNAQETEKLTTLGQTINLENSKVKKYLDEVTYTYSSPCILADYVGTSTKDDETPRGVEIDLSSLPEDKTFEYILTDGETTERSGEVRLSDERIVFTNLIPGKTYNFHVYDTETHDEVMHNYFNTDGRLRMIGFPTMYNTRDMGGWQTLDGKRTKYGMLYRGVEMHEGKHNTASEQDLRGMMNLGMAAELDMRRTYPVISSSDFINNVIPESSAFGSDVPYLCVNLAGTESMLSAYPTKFGDALHFIVKNLSEGRPVFYHCVWGADRTGTLSALILAMMGVSLSDIYKEYELTAFSTYSSMRDKESINTRVMKVIGYNEESTNTLQECAIQYAHFRLGISDEEISTLQSLLLEENHDVPTSMPDGIRPATPTLASAIYSASGIRSSVPHRGLNIMRDADGTTRKIMVK